MGLQATSPPTSPLHRPPPVINPAAPMLKRKHDVLEPDQDDVLMSVTTGGSGVKKICVEVVCGSERTVGTEPGTLGRNDLRHTRRTMNNSDEDVEDYSDSDEVSNDSSDGSDSDQGSSSTLEDSIMITSSNESMSMSGISSDLPGEEEDKENHINMNKLNHHSKELDSILAKTLLNSTSSGSTPGTPSGAIVVTTASAASKNDNELQSPKVIVEHKPLPSIYDLQQMSAACDTLDVVDNGNLHHQNSGLVPGVVGVGPHGVTDLREDQQSKENDSGVSDDEEDDEVSDLESEEEDEHPSSSPIFDPVLRGTTPAKQALLPSPPKAIYSNDNRFWNSNPQQPQNTYNSNQQGPPGHHQPNTFQFLDQTTQRIECAENGKSYLQLGTMNAHTHHHLPVTPVIQPKPNMVYRRPIPPFRTHMAPLSSTGSNNGSQLGSNPRPVCDHSNCFNKKNSFCYQSQRSRMLNLSLSKLHMARQSHDGSLRRSVLICNMLRYIEDETDREAMNESSQYSHMETSEHHYWGHQVPPQAGQQQQQQQQQQPPQPPVSQAPQQPQQQQQTAAPSQQPQIVNPGISVSSDAPNLHNLVTSIAASNNGQPGNAQQPPNLLNQSFNAPSDTYGESALKDFNTAFRATPYSSPAHPGSDMDSGLGVGDDVDRGINWSSVLSLSSQSELDPLNNNTFATEAWPNTANTPTTLPSSGSMNSGTTLTDISSSTVSSASMTSVAQNRGSTPISLAELGCSTPGVTASTLNCTGTSSPNVNSSSFDDIGWKLSADDVLKAFPNDENLFAVTGP